MVELPILILTAKNHTRSYLEGLACGANDYLAKPFDKRELMARAKTLLSMREAVVQAIEHNRHFEAERLKRGLSESLRQVSEILSSTLELNQVLARFLECLDPIFHYSRAMIILEHEGQPELAISKGFDCDDEQGRVFRMASQLMIKGLINKKGFSINEPKGASLLEGIDDVGEQCFSVSPSSNKVWLVV